MTHIANIVYIKRIKASYIDNKTLEFVEGRKKSKRNLKTKYKNKSERIKAIG